MFTSASELYHGWNTLKKTQVIHVLRRLQRIAKDFFARELPNLSNFYFFFSVVRAYRGESESRVCQL